MSEKLQLEDIKQLQLDILVAFDSLCQEHNLRYVLAYGTLIGAVRHGGFIPWDDDIDLCMPHKDFLKLVEIVNARGNGGMITDRYRLADARVNSDIPYHQTFAKIYDTKTIAKKSSLKQSIGFQEGVFIDIFTISGIPSDKAQKKQHLAKLEYANEMAYYASRKCQPQDLNPLHPRRFLTNLSGYLMSSKRTIGEWISLYAECLDKLPDSDESEIAYDVKGWLISGDRFALTCNPWFPSISVQFEGKSFPIPKRYDEMLLATYGDYMQLPPEEKRQPTHDQDFYLL